MLEQLVTNHVLRYVLVGVVLIGVGMEVLLGIKYSGMIRRTLEIGNRTHPFTEKFKQSFLVSYKFGLNVNNVDKFVDKHVNKQKILGVFLCTWEKRCGQARILSGCIAVISMLLCIYLNCGRKVLFEEGAFVIFMCTMWISFVMLSDIRGKKKRLQWSLSEYLENVYIPRLEKEENDPDGFQKIKQELQAKEETVKMQERRKETKKPKEKVQKVKKEKASVKREELEQMKKELVEELKQERKKREKKGEELKEKQEETAVEAKAEKTASETKEETVKQEDGEQLLQEILREYLGEV